MSEDDLIAVDHKLAELQRRRRRYVERLSDLDPRENAAAVAAVLSLIDEVNSDLVRLSNVQAQS